MSRQRKLSQLAFVLYTFIAFVMLLANSCFPKGQSPKVEIGQDTYICVYIMPLSMNNTGKYLQLAVTTTADKLTKIRVLNGWTSVNYVNDTVMERIGVTESFGAGSAITIGSMGTLSYQRIYRQIRTETSIERVNMTAYPTSQPSSSPSLSPSSQPSSSPTAAPSSLPTSQPSSQPISSPSHSPTGIPTSQPSRQPSRQPSAQPSDQPTSQPSSQPSRQPSQQPTALPSSSPTSPPSTQPTTVPSSSPSTSPSVMPSIIPSSQPTSEPSAKPSASPSGTPTKSPSSQPTSTPSTAPTESPSSNPTSLPSAFPSASPTTSTRRLQEVNAATDGVSVVTVGNDFITYPVNQTTAVTFPMLFAMIIVENGKVKSIAWDNFCSWCEAHECAQNTLNYDSQILSNIGPNCFLPDDQCYDRREAVTDDANPANATVTSNQLCELTVYIAWEGTDVNGINFNSAAYRFSRWSLDQIGNFTSSLEEKTIFI